MINGKKIGLGIVAFDACEHLKNIITELEGLIDYIVLGVQKVSYHGNKIDKADLNECEKLLKENLVNEIYWASTDLKKEPREQETDKRNMLLDILEHNGCDYSLIIDSDEFYKRNQFENACAYVIDNKIDLSYCRYVNYFADYKHYLVYPFKEGCWVPFVTRSRYRFTWEGVDFTKASDPTRRYVRDRSADGTVYTDVQFEFPWKMINMHHFSWIRADISKKLENWSAKLVFPNYLFLSDKSIEVLKEFKHDPEAINQAVLLFNTPDNKVDIQEFPRQYVSPKHKIEDILDHVYENKNICILVDLDYDPDFTFEDIKRRYSAYEDEYTKVIYYTGDDKLKNTENVIYISGAPVNYPYKKYTKFVKALECIKNEMSDIDWVIKIEPDTWINKKWLVDAINNNYLYKRCIWGVHTLETFHTKWNPYISDEVMILSDICVDKLISTYNADIEAQYPNRSAVLCGAILNTEYMNVGLKDNRSMWRSIDHGVMYGFKDMDYDKGVNNFFVKIIWNKEMFEPIWNWLDEHAEKNSEALSNVDLKAYIDNFNQKIIHIPTTKEEWIKANLDSYRECEIINNMVFFKHPENPQV